MAKGAITKTGTLATTFHKPTGEANTYVRFGYGPLEIFNNKRGKVSGSMSSDAINMIHTTERKIEISTFVLHTHAIFLRLFKG